MKKLLAVALISSVTSITFVTSASFAKVGARLNDRQAMKCIDTDSMSKFAFQDLQAAYEMRLVTAKDFFKVMDKPANCPQLRKDLKKLHQATLAQLPQPKGSPSRSQSFGGGSSVSADSRPAFGGPAALAPGANHDNPGAGFNENYESFPPPPPMPVEDFDEDFSDFR